MWAIPGYRPSDMEEPTLGTAELPAITPARVTVPCGERFDWNEASDHYLLCEECDRIHRARNFVDPQMG
jgi:hypothetical protein